MSWIKENYHIASLGGGALVLAGLGYMGMSGNQAVNEEFDASNPPKKEDTSTPGGEMAAAIAKSVTEPNPVKQPTTATGRPVNMFTSVDLYTKDGRTQELLDLLQMESPVHPPIPNQWWVDNRIDPSFSDSPQRDEDGDGFTNLEEFEAKTDPTKDDDYGELITKLRVVNVESDMWLLLFKSVLGSGYQFDLKYKPFGGRTLSNRIPASDAVQKGDLFFKEEPGKERFVIKDIEAREEQGPTGLRPRNWAIVEDQRANKKGQVYELPFNMKKGNTRKFTQFDHTVTFKLAAIGEESNRFKVEENGTFALPSGGEEKVYKLIKVNLTEELEPSSVVVEYKVGTETKTIEIPVPQAAPETPEDPDNG